jgi:hypothetical protein
MHLFTQDFPFITLRRAQPDDDFVTDASVFNITKIRVKWTKNQVPFDPYQSSLIERHHQMCIKGTVKWGSEVKFDGTGDKAKFIYKVFGPRENAFKCVNMHRGTESQVFREEL